MRASATFHRQKMWREHWSGAASFPGLVGLTLSCCLLSCASCQSMTVLIVWPTAKPTHSCMAAISVWKHCHARRAHTHSTAWLFASWPDRLLCGNWWNTYIVPNSKPVECSTEKLVFSRAGWFSLSWLSGFQFEIREWLSLLITPTFPSFGLFMCF